MGVGDGEEVDGRDDDEEGSGREGGEGRQMKEGGRGEGKVDFFICFSKLGLN